MVLRRSKSQVLFIIKKIIRYKALKGDAQREQSLKDGLGIFFCWPDEDVEVIGSAKVAVPVHRYTANHGKFNLCGGERG